MKIRLCEGEVICTLENKDSSFLAACSGLFSGFSRGGLKLQLIDVAGAATPVDAAEDALHNDWQIQDLLRNADRYGIEVEQEVRQFAKALELKREECNACCQAEIEAMKATERWETLCRSGCEGCRNISYDIDLPVCKQTGEVLKTESVPKYIGGVLRLFNFEPFPSEDCPFNIKKQGV